MTPEGSDAFGDEMNEMNEIAAIVALVAADAASRACQEEARVKAEAELQNEFGDQWRN